MKVIPHLPPYVLVLVTTYFEVIIAWLSERLYDRVVKAQHDDLLVRLRQHLDFAPLERACAGFHHQQGPGAPPTHTVPRLVRALLVGLLFNCSLRGLESLIDRDNLVKWFLGYSLFEAAPDHTTLARFILWVEAHQHRLFFDEILRQIDADFPGERSQPQVGDTFAMQANAARETLMRLLRHTAERLLVSLKQASAAEYALAMGQLDQTALFGAADEPNEYRLDDAGRKARLQTTVLAARRCLALVQQALDRATDLAPSDRRTIKTWCARLQKVIRDEVVLTVDAQGEVSAVSLLPEKERGTYRLGSASDPEATYRVHGEHKVDLGYNVNLAATSHFVREISAATGAEPDACGVPDLLTAQAEHQGAVPPKLIYDAAAGNGKTLAEVAKASAGQTQLVAPLVSHEKAGKRFGPSCFSLSEDGQTLRCPNGEVSHLAYRSGAADGRLFHFAAPQCQGCPLFARCRDPKADPQSVRQVFISDYRPLVEAARVYAETAAYKADMRQRPLVERIIAVLTRYRGARRARRIGLGHADFQAKLCAAALNLRQWIALLLAREARHPSHQA